MQGRLQCVSELATLLRARNHVRPCLHCFWARAPAREQACPAHKPEADSQLQQVGCQKPPHRRPLHLTAWSHSFLPSWSLLVPRPPHKGHVMEKLVVGRGQEVSGWGPSEGQQIQAGAWSRGGQAQGQRSDTALRSAGGTSPPQPGECTAPCSSPVSRARFVHSFILCSCAWCLQQAWPCSSADRQGGKDALLSGKLFPGKK